MVQDNRFYTEMSREPLGLVRIGTKFEIMNTKYDKLNKYNHYGNYEIIVDTKTFYETKRLLYSLDLPIQLLPHIIHDVKIFYNKIEKGTKYRAPYKLVPITIYITCLRDFIFINLPNLYEVSMCTQQEFGQCLRMIYKLFPDIYIEFMSKKFRIKTILSQLMGLKLYFNFPNDFIYISSNILKSYYNKLKNTKIPVITARVFRLTKDCMKNQMNEFTDIEICKRLGVQSSTCSKIKL